MQKYCFQIYKKSFRTAEFNPIIAILMGREPFFNEKGASADAETPLLYPEPKPRYCCILRSKLT